MSSLVCLKGQEINDCLGKKEPWIPEGGFFFLILWGFFVCWFWHCLSLPLCCQSALLPECWLWCAADTDLEGQRTSPGFAHSWYMLPFCGLPVCLCCAWSWERVNLGLLFYINMSFCKHVPVLGLLCTSLHLSEDCGYFYTSASAFCIFLHALYCCTHFLVDAEMFCMVSCWHNTGLITLFYHGNPTSSYWVLYFCQLERAAKILFSLLHCPGNSSRLLCGSVSHWHNTHPVLDNLFWWLSP